MIKVQLVIRILPDIISSQLLYLGYLEKPFPITPYIGLLDNRM